MKNHVGLLWYRSDLRTRDHRALAEATRSHDQVVAVFLISPEQWHSHGLGGNQIDFVLRAIASLRQSLQPLGIPLCVRTAPRFADAPNAISQVAREVGASAVYAHAEPPLNERRRDLEVAAQLRAAGILWRLYDDERIIPVGTLRAGSGQPHRRFSSFKRAWLAHLHHHHDVLNQAPGPRPMPRPQADSDPVPRALPGFSPTLSDPSAWPATESEATARLAAFIARAIDRYHERRDLPAAETTSALSPYLNIGLISARACVRAAVLHNRGELQSGNPGVTAWVNELIWREFYREIAASFDHVSRHRPFNPKADWRWPDSGPAFSAWQRGRTGIPLVDAGMRQLHQTGWMHNRLRMVCAMFLSKQLLVDWRLGERHFACHLLDADFSANNGGWQWCAGTGTDAAPYFRVFNPVRQARRFDPEGAFVRAMLPELTGLTGPEVFEPWRLGTEGLRRRGYPEPICDLTDARQRALEFYFNAKSATAGAHG